MWKTRSAAAVASSGRGGAEVAATKFSSMLGFCGPLRAISSGVRLGLVWSEFFPSDADQLKSLSC